jgi:hypothetical protein
LLDPNSPSLIAEALHEIWDEIFKLVESKIIVTQGVTLYHNDCEIEYIIHLNLGPTVTRTDRVAKVIHSFAHVSWTVHDVVKVWGTGLMGGEDLKRMGVISQSGTKATIDMAKLIRNVQSESVIIGIRKKILPELRAAILSVNISKNALLVDGNKEVRFSVGLDYANMWKGVFQSFSVKDVFFTYGLEVTEGSIEGLVSDSFKLKLKRAKESLAKGNRQAPRFFNAVSKEFLTFESDEIMGRLREIVAVEPADRIEIMDITPKMQSFQVAGTDFPITIPGKVIVRFRTGIEENEIMVNGKVTFNLAKFRSAISEMTKRIESQTKGYVFS